MALLAAMKAPSGDQLKGQYLSDGSFGEDLPETTEECA